MTLTLNLPLIFSFYAVCDPVMGDNGKLYVSEDLVEIYRKEVIPGADFLKPNQTELEYTLSLTLINILLY